MNTAMIDWVKQRRGRQGCNIPWYLDAESKDRFSYWNQVTRAASIWRNLVESGMTFCSKNPESSIQLKYEDLVCSPMRFVAQFEQVFGLEATEITKKHLNSIKNHEISRHPSVHKDIEKPECDKFMSLMEKFGYLG